MRVNNESQIGGVTLDLKCTHSHTHKALEGVVVSDVSICFLLTVNVQSQVWLNSNRSRWFLRDTTPSVIDG